MADLLIRGASLPKHCGECQFMADGWCYAVSQRPDDFVTFDRRPDFCPLVELPDHGDLIDRAELLKKCPEWGYSPRQIKEADTIIPASKEGVE